MKLAGPMAGPDRRGQGHKGKGNRLHSAPPDAKEVGGVGRDEVAPKDQREEASDARLTGGACASQPLWPESCNRLMNLPIERCHQPVPEILRRVVGRVI